MIDKQIENLIRENELLKIRTGDKISKLEWVCDIRKKKIQQLQQERDFLSKENKKLIDTLLYIKGFVKFEMKPSPDTTIIMDTINEVITE